MFGRTRLHEALGLDEPALDEGVFLDEPSLDERVLDEGVAWTTAVIWTTGGLHSFPGGLSIASLFEFCAFMFGRLGRPLKTVCHYSPGSD